MRGAGTLLTGRIATLAGRDGPGWVEAIAIDGGRVIAAGRLADVEAALAPGARRLHLAPDEVAIPGLTDAHLHLAEAALARRRVDLEDARSIGDVIERVRAAADARPDGAAWIEGAGWDPDLVGRWPTADDLEIAAPGRLVALWAHDHHALLVSRAALEAAGIDDDLPDPEGGVIRRDEDGRATGVLHETAVRLVSSLVPAPTTADVEDALEPLVRELVDLGVVAVHDPGGLSERRDLGGPIAAYRELAAAGRLGLRVHACIRAEQLDVAEMRGSAQRRAPRAGPARSPPHGLAEDLRRRIPRLADRGPAAAAGARPRRAAAAQRRLRRVAGPARRAASPGGSGRRAGDHHADPRHRGRCGPGCARCARAHRRPHSPDAAGGARTARPSRGHPAVRRPRHRRLDAADPRPLGRREGPSPLGRPGRGMGLRGRGAGPGRRCHRVRYRRARGAGGPVARPRMRGDAVVARRGRRGRRRSGPRTRSISGGRSGRRAWTRPSPPARRTGGGSWPASEPTWSSSRRQPSTSRSRLVGPCGMPDPGWCSSTARLPRAGRESAGSVRPGAPPGRRGPPRRAR